MMTARGASHMCFLSEKQDALLASGVTLIGPWTDERVAGGAIIRRYKNGAITFSPDAGLHAIHGDIYRAWVSLGAHQTLGFPMTDQASAGDGVGQFSHFRA